MCYYLKNTHDKFEGMLKGNPDRFRARNNVQIHYALNLTKTFIEVRTLPTQFKRVVGRRLKFCPAIQPFLLQLFNKTNRLVFQHFFLKRMYQKLSKASDPAIKSVLTRMFALYGVWSLDKHLGTFYQGGYMEGALPATLIRDSVIQLCGELKDDAISLIDVLAPRDEALQSCLGHSDGQVKQISATKLSHI